MPARARDGRMQLVLSRVKRYAESQRKTALFLAYTLSSAAFVLMNRALLRQFCHPLFVTAVQQLIVAGSYAAVVLHFGGSRVFSLEGARAIWTCALFFVAMVVMNNICLRFSQVSGYVIARASTLIFNMILSSVFLQQCPSLGAVAAVLTVVLAIFVGTDMTAMKSAEMVGVLTGVCASASQAAFSCAVSKTLVATKQTPLFIMGHYTLMSLVLMVPLFLLGIEPLPSWEELANPANVTLLALTGLTNVIVALTAIGSLQMSNPITVNLLGYVKSVGQSLLSVWLLNEPLTFNKGIGLALTIAGSFGYSMTRILARRKDLVAKKSE